MTVQTERRLPTVGEYLRLIDSVGWSEYASPQTAKTALENTLFAVVAKDGQAVVGCGRIIGDCALFFYIQDVIVVPMSQGRGIGAMIMEELLSWLSENAPAHATVGLFAAQGKGPFYEKYGFGARNPDRPGMELRIRSYKD